MDKRIDDQELREIIANVDLISQERGRRLSSSQVRSILVELGLPSDLLEPAVLQLQERQAKAVQQRRRFHILGLAIVCAVFTAGWFLYESAAQHQAFSAVRGQYARLTSEPDTGSLALISLRTLPEIVYRVTLRDAPIGRRLPLTCEWMGSDGVIMKQNRFLTRVITTTPWETHCRFRTHSSLSPGTWRVQMRQDGRVISEQSFVVD